MSGKGILNLSTAGYCPPTELIVLKKYGLSTKPKKIILQLTEANDLKESYEYRTWIVKNKPRYNFQKINTTKYQQWQQRSILHRIYKIMNPNTLNPYSWEGHYEVEGRQSISVRFEKLSGSHLNPEENPGWEIMKNSILEIDRICDSLNIELYVLFIPEKFNVLKDIVRFDDFIKTSLYKSNLNYKTSSIEQLLEELSYRMNRPFINVKEDLQTQSKNGTLSFLPFDTHLSPEGHTKVAELLYERLYNH